MADDSDYKVGYCQPPLHSRWVKGCKSPNPNGRRGKKRKPELGASGMPKTTMDLLADTILEEMMLPVTVKDAKGKPKELPKFQAMFRKWLHEQLTLPSTSAASRKHLTDLTALAANHSLAAEREWADFVTANKAMLEELLRKERQLRRDAERRGDKVETAVSDPLPHPDNFVTNPFTGEYRIDGPVDEQQLALEAEFLSQRGDAEYVMGRSMMAYRAATTDEERQLHRDAHAHARSIWLHYNSRVSLRNTHPEAFLGEYDLEEAPPPWQDEF